jgi:hypothetical protein
MFYNLFSAKDKIDKTYFVFSNYDHRDTHPQDRVTADCHTTLWMMKHFRKGIFDGDFQMVPSLHEPGIMHIHNLT